MNKNKKLFIYKILKVLTDLYIVGKNKTKLLKVFDILEGLQINTTGKKQKMFSLMDIPIDVIVFKIAILLPFQSVLDLEKSNTWFYSNLKERFWFWKLYFYELFVKQFSDYFSQKFNLVEKEYLKDEKYMIQIYPKYEIKDKIVKKNWKARCIFFDEFFGTELIRFDLEQLFPFRDLYGVRVQYGDELLIFHLIFAIPSFYISWIPLINDKRFQVYAYIISLQRGVFSSEKIPKYFLNDRSIVLRMIKASQYIYDELPQGLKCDKDVILELVKHNGRNLQEISKKCSYFKEDPEILEKAIMNARGGIFVSKFKHDVDMILKVIKRGNMFSLLPDPEFDVSYFKKKDLVLIAIESLKFRKFHVLNIIAARFFQYLDYDSIYTIIKFAKELDFEKTKYICKELHHFIKDITNKKLKIFKRVLKDLKIFC